MVVARTVFVTESELVVLVTLGMGCATRITARKEFSRTAAGDRMSALCDSTFIVHLNMDRRLLPATPFLPN